MDISGILSNEITHLVFALIAGVAAMALIVALLLLLSRWFRK